MFYPTHMLQCNSCKEKIFSMSRSEYTYCKCGSIGVIEDKFGCHITGEEYKKTKAKPRETFRRPIGHEYFYLKDIPTEKIEEILSKQRMSTEQANLFKDEIAYRKKKGEL